MKAEEELITADHDQDIFGVLEDEERAELQRLLIKVRVKNSARAPRTEPTTRALIRRIK